MKVTQVPGTGTPAGQDVATTRSPDKIERAKAIAAGQVPEEKPSGDYQVDKVQNSIKKIKMKTQVSTNRDDVPAEPVVETPQVVAEEPQKATPDTVEQASDTEDTRPLSPQFAALAKTKRALQVKERELADREAALKSAPAGEDWKATLKADPLSVLQEAGVTYEQLTEAILNNQSAPIDPQKLRNELKEELKKELMGEFGSRDQLAEQQVLAELKKDAINLTANGEEYEAIREAKAQDYVVELVHRNWKKTGEIMDLAEAAQLVEDQLIEEALPFAKIQKVQSRLNPASEAPAAQSPAVPKPNTKVMRTLTNRDTASPVLDRRARAIAAMMGTLKRG